MTLPKERPPAHAVNQATDAELEAAIAARLLHRKMEKVSIERQEGPDGPIMKTANRILYYCTGLCGKARFEAWRS